MGCHYVLVTMYVCMYVHIYIHILLLRNALSVKVNDSMIIRDNTSLGGKGMPVLARYWNAVTLRRALKAMGKNDESMCSKIYDISTMQTIGMK